MQFRWFTSFTRFAHSSITKYYSSAEANLPAYSDKLTKLVHEFIGEKRTYLLDPVNTISEKIEYLSTLNFKINILYTNLFKEDNKDVIYLPDKLIITNDYNNDINLSVLLLRRNILKLIDELKRDYTRITTPNHLSQRTIIAGKRLPKRESFEIIEGKTVNLRAVYNRLTDPNHPFIQTNTSYEDFEILFSGDPVINKVVWLKANALHYFIDRIHGRGVKRANEGKWARASRCFMVLDKDSTPRDIIPYQIKDAGDPVASVTVILDRAINLFL